MATEKELLKKAMELLESSAERYEPSDDQEYGYCLSCGRPTWEHKDDCEYMELRRQYESLKG